MRVVVVMIVIVMGVIAFFVIMTVGLLGGAGGPGGASTVFLRGGNANHTLVLVDGIRVGSTGQGVFDFAHLPLEQIERIEIVRGPRAALWGSDAIAGVVHVFTRDPSRASVRVQAGSYGRAGASAAGAFGVVLVALIYRLRIEERALAAALGDRYREFAARRARLIPYVW